MVFNTQFFVVLAVSVASSFAIAQQVQPPATTTVLNCGYATESGNRTTGTRSAGDMARYDLDCGNETKFGYEKKVTIPLNIPTPQGQSIKVGSRYGSKHYGCHGDNNAKDGSDIVKNKNSNYILVHRNGDKKKVYAVAIPTSVGLSCNLLWRSGTVYNRYREIK